MSRLFIALPIPDEIAAQVAPLQFGLAGAKFSPRENLHITLRFIGKASESLAGDLARQLAQDAQNSFDLSLAGADFFGSEKPHSLHLKIAQNSNLFELNEKCEAVCRNLGLEPEVRGFAPHLTLAYLKGADLAEVERYKKQHAQFKSPIWRADCFRLYSSKLGNGPSEYEILAEFSLF
ncbi:MAG: RNA 2',3'-cyclic phosphodiesterase [Pseudomonadota bacterium]